MLKNSEFVSKLRNSGLRPTKQRLKICEVLFNRDKTFHFTIYDLAKNISENFNEKISLATIYNTVHAFKNKGYLKEGYDADLTIADMNKEVVIKNEMIASKCGWTPFNNHKVKGFPVATIVNGHLVMSDGKVVAESKGTPLKF